MMRCSLKVPTGELATREDGRSLLLEVRRIRYIEAAGNYACVHVDERTHVIRETLAHLEALLQPFRFLRIHRSTLVNQEWISELSVDEKDAAVQLNDGHRLTVSRRSRHRLDLGA